ncbi:MAG: hypothetical protein IPH16_00545 [Haliscomenobacter sp.]|nr:hypothetical protein [Haliscomenobacter sp.]MBK7476798.1 hypothetical protein [Haliscomenobacter sp.]MBK8878730.1 hypothetical protein [Haliscomenobacter sp.]
MQTHDFLESFVRENREAFDREGPDPRLWKQIDQQLHGPSMRRLKTVRILRAIAAALLLLITGAVGGRLVGYKQASDATALLEQTAPEFLEAEQYYQQQIQGKLTQLASYNPGETVFRDLDQLDQVMEELKTELAKAPQGKEQEIISNLIRNYQTKMAILELVMNRLETNQSDYAKQNEHEVNL